jgi:protein phosphatase
MGGAAAGEVASATAIERLQEAFAAAGAPTPDDLIEAAQEANRAVWEQAEANPEMRGMGTTLVALAPVADGRLAVINIGDSRLYLLHDGELRQVTSDHNLVAELVAEGRLSKEEAEYHPRRNIMTRALGVDPEVPVDLFMLDAVPGDRFLLCSDGLPRELHDDQIASLLRRLAHPEEAARELVDEAKRRGGNDNITVVVVDVVAPGEEKDADLTAAAPTPSPAQPVVTAPRRAKRSFITGRVVVFVGLLLVLLGLGAAGIGWYARASYFVGLRGDRITIFQGRPGGVLWFRPTVADATSVTTADVESRHLPALSSGQDEPSLTAARQFVHSMVAEQQAAQAAAHPPVPPKPTSQPKPRSTTPSTT